MSVESLGRRVRLVEVASFKTVEIIKGQLRLIGTIRIVHPEASEEAGVQMEGLRRRNYGQDPLLTVGDN